MNFLQMAQEVRKLSGITGTGPASVTEDGPYSVLSSIVDQVYQDLQNSREEWKWMKGESSFSTQPNIKTYTVTDVLGLNNRFKRWELNTFFIKVSGQSSLLQYRDYETFRSLHVDDTSSHIPAEFTVVPETSALMLPSSNGVYSVSFRYKKNNQHLTNNADIPELPIDYHLLVVYEAVALYNLSIGQGYLYLEYKKKADGLWGDLLRNQLEPVKIRLRALA